MAQCETRGEERTMTRATREKEDHTILHTHSYSLFSSPSVCHRCKRALCAMKMSDTLDTERDTDTERQRDRGSVDSEAETGRHQKRESERETQRQRDRDMYRERDRESVDSAELFDAMS